MWITPSFLHLCKLWTLSLISVFVLITNQACFKLTEHRETSGYPRYSRWSWRFRSRCSERSDAFEKGGKVELEKEDAVLLVRRASQATDGRGKLPTELQRRQRPNRPSQGIPQKCQQAPEWLVAGWCPVWSRAGPRSGQSWTRGPASQWRGQFTWSRWKPEWKQ